MLSSDWLGFIFNMLPFSAVNLSISLPRNSPVFRDTSVHGQYSSQQQKKRLDIQISLKSFPSRAETTRTSYFSLYKSLFLYFPHRNFLFFFPPPCRKSIFTFLPLRSPVSSLITFCTTSLVSLSLSLTVSSVLLLFSTPAA